MPEKKMTKAERRWAFQHAKQHAIEAINDTLTDERHSSIKQDGVFRPDIQSEVIEELKRIKRTIRARKFIW